jgi:flagellar motor component MotA
MNREEFIKAYHDFIDTALGIALKARREGILALDGDVDREKAGQRDIFHYGLQFAVDGVASEIIDKIISNIAAQEKDEYTRILKTIQKEAVMGIQQGFNHQLLHYVLNSYTDLPIMDEETKFGIDEDELQYEREEGKYDGEI